MMHGTTNIKYKRAVSLPVQNSEYKPQHFRSTQCESLWTWATCQLLSWLLSDRL